MVTDPARVCRDCEYYEPLDADGGECYALPAQLALTSEEQPVFFRAYAVATDRGCIYWCPRHKA